MKKKPRQKSTTHTQKKKKKTKTRKDNLGKSSDILSMAWGKKSAGSY